MVGIISLNRKFVRRGHLEHWDMQCAYENGVELHFMDSSSAEKVVTDYKPGEWKGGDGVVFHGTEGWIGNISDGFQASDRSLWRTEFKAVDWDPVKELVVGNSAAAKLMSPQPVRDKWKVS